MALRNRKGVLIAGGGLSGSLAALALARLRPDVPLLIVEERPRFGGGRFHFWLRSELDRPEAALLDPIAELRWPGFYLAFPELSRNLKLPLAGFSADALHQAMIATLKPDQYRLNTRVVAVRENAVELDGGETVRAEGSIDARGPANLSTLELLFETCVERVIRTRLPHRLDRPLLLDATVEQNLGFTFVRAFPLDAQRMRIAKVLVSERAQPGEAAEARLDHYVARRGWAPAEIEDRATGSQPLPMGGDFGAYWRIGGARVAKLGLRAGLVQPATGRGVADAARAALLLAGQPDFAGTALHDAFEAHARQLWRRRDLPRAVIAALAATRPEERRSTMERLYRLEPGLIARFQADRLGVLGRRRVGRALQPQGVQSRT